MIERKDDKHLVTLIHTNDRVSLLYICSIVSMCKEDTLRVSGRTGSVADVCIIIRPDRLISLDELILVLGKEFITHLHYFTDVDLVLTHICNLIEEDDLLHHRTIRKDCSDLRKLEL